MLQVILGKILREVPSNHGYKIVTKDPDFWEIFVDACKNVGEHSRPPQLYETIEEFLDEKDFGGAYVHLGRDMEPEFMNVLRHVSYVSMPGDHAEHIERAFVNSPYEFYITPDKKYILGFNRVCDHGEEIIDAIKNTLTPIIKEC